jgi:hypothetical protein
MPTDVKLIKAALEEAKFENVELREKIYECINELDEDLSDAHYAASENCDEVFDELEAMLAEIEEEESDEEEDRKIADDDIDPSKGEDDEDDEDDEDADDDDDDDEEEFDDDEDVPDELKNL